MNFKSIGRFSLLCFLLIFCIGINTAEAQRKRDTRKKKGNDVEEYFDESGNFASRLWYGGGFGLGLTNNEFQVSLSPMVGYKIFDQLSVGPAGKIEYYRANVYDFANNVYKYRSFNWAIGGFTRAKIFGDIFLHVQLEYESQAIPDEDGRGNIIIDGNNVATTRGGKEALLLGGGYSSNGGGLLGFEIMLLYNVLEDNDYVLPWDIRAGINYNF